MTILRGTEDGREKYEWCQENGGREVCPSVDTKLGTVYRLMMVLNKGVNINN